MQVNKNVSRRSKAENQAALTHVIEQATGEEAAALQISLRQPLTFQSNRLYDVWVNGRHLIAKEFLKPEEEPETAVA